MTRSSSARRHHSGVAGRVSVALIIAVAAGSRIAGAGDGAGDTRPTTDAHIEEMKSYWTSIGVDLMVDPTGEPDKRYGLFVISGTLKNVSSEPIRVVILDFTLITKDGSVVHRRESFNRKAEALLDAEDAAAAARTQSALEAIAPGATDSYRMIFIGEEIPAFDHPAVSIRAVR